MRRLFSEKPQDQTLELDSAVELPKRICRTFKTLDDLDPTFDCYNKPLSSNFESIDSIVFPNMLFQVTVGSKHGVKVSLAYNFLVIFFFISFLLGSWFKSTKRQEHSGFETSDIFDICGS